MRRLELLRVFIRFVVSCGFSLTPSILSSSRLFGKRFYSISFRAFSVFTPMSFLTSWSLLRAGTIDSEMVGPWGEGDDDLQEGRRTECIPAGVRVFMEMTWLQLIGRIPGDPRSSEA